MKQIRNTLSAHRSLVAWTTTMFVFALMFLTLQYAEPVRAQGTSTSTPTNTATPTATNTPIATPLSMAVSNLGGNSVRCGFYNETLLQSGDCFQALGGSGIGVYSAAGQRVFAVNGETGAVQINGTTSVMRYGTAATYTSGTSITHGFTVSPTACMVSPMQSITATYTITATGFSTNMATTASPIMWFCGQ